MATAPCLTIADLNKLHPCAESGDRVRRALRKLNGDAAHCFTAAQARDAGCTFEDIVWAASAVARTDKAVERRLRLWTADCAARVLHIFERDCPGDDRPRRAIEAARAFANGEIDDAARSAARDAAWAASDAASAAAWAAASAAAWAASAAASAAARDAASAASAAARDAASAAAWAASAAASAAARAAAWAAARDAASAAAWAAEESWQFDRLIAWLSDDEPQPLALPAPALATRLEAVLAEAK